MAEYTLGQIKSHQNFPFLDFEKNDLSFLMLELYWGQLFLEKIKGKTEEKEWLSLEEAERDGNPIFCVTSIAKKRKLKIIQKTNEDNKPVYPASKGEAAYYPLQAWLNISHSPDSYEELNELVLFADLSDEAEEELLKLLQMHCIELADINEVEKAIQSYEDRVGMPD